MWKNITRLRIPLSWLLVPLIYLDLTCAIEFTHHHDHSSWIYEADTVEQGIQKFEKGNTLNLDNLVILQESVPVKDSLNYNSLLSYKFEPDLSSQWINSYQLLVYLSASMCQLPTGWDTGSSNNGLSIYYTFNSTLAESMMIDQMSEMDFNNGFAEGLAEITIVGDRTDYTLYIITTPDYCDNCTNDSTWVFELAISQRTTLFVYDTDARISVVDVDYTSALFEAEEIIFGVNRTYGMYIFENNYPLPVALNQSWCAINEVSEYKQVVNINETNVRGHSNVFLVSDLEVASSYSAVLVITYTNLPYGGGVFQPFNFTTSKTKSCRLAYDLDFCDEVAYAVPISADLLYNRESWQDFIAAYDNYTESLYKPFEFAMQLITCDTELDARYSPIRTCDDCKYSYKQWLCAVSIPRCVSDLDAGLQNKHYRKEDGRNELIRNIIKPPLPYAEVFPCLNVCQAIVRDCPSDFGFSCPQVPALAKLSYGDPEFEDSGNSFEGLSTATAVDGSVETYRVCNYLGGSNIATSTTTSPIA